MRSLPIVCERCCGATRQELERAVAVLDHVLRPFGIDPRLEIVETDEASFEANAAESPRIWIAGKPMEEWLDGTLGCGHRPEQLIPKAVLIASSELIDGVTVGALSAALVGRATPPWVAASAR